MLSPPFLQTAPFLIALSPLLAAAMGAAAVWAWIETYGCLREAAVGRRRALRFTLAGLIGSSALGLGIVATMVAPPAPGPAGVSNEGLGLQNVALFLLPTAALVLIAALARTDRVFRWPGFVRALDRHRFEAEAIEAERDALRGTLDRYLLPVTAALEHAARTVKPMDGPATVDLVRLIEEARRRLSGLHSVGNLAAPPQEAADSVVQEVLEPLVEDFTKISERKPSILCFGAEGHAVALPPTVLRTVLHAAVDTALRGADVHDPVVELLFTAHSGTLHLRVAQNGGSVTGLVGDAGALETARIMVAAYGGSILPPRAPYGRRLEVTLPLSIRRDRAASTIREAIDAQVVQT